MSEPLYDDEGVTTVSKTTPLHDITWYVKWAGTIILVFAVSAINLSSQQLRKYQNDDLLFLLESMTSVVLTEWS